MSRLVVVGSANVDFVVKTPHIPCPGETVLGRDFVMIMGGKGANQAVGAARLGAKVTLVTCIGQDLFGDQCLEAYQKEGIETRYIKRVADTATGVALIAVAQSGENSITVASGANRQLLPEDVEKASSAFGQADVLLVQLEVPIETIAYATELARKYGLRTILNPAPAHRLPANLLPNVDVITPNRIEAMQLLGIHPTESVSDEMLARQIQKLGPGAVVITLGKNGALCVNQSECAHISAFPIKAVDTTGAGDAFSAGLAVALGEKEQTWLQAVQYANACGALATTQLGAQSSLPSSHQVKTFFSIA